MSRSFSELSRAVHLLLGGFRWSRLALEPNTSRKGDAAFRPDASLSPRAIPRGFNPRARAGRDSSFVSRCQSVSITCLFANVREAWQEWRLQCVDSNVKERSACGLLGARTLSSVFVYCRFAQAPVFTRSAGRWGRRRLSRHDVRRAGPNHCRAGRFARYRSRGR